MANRRFEMHQYRHILVRMRLGETDRQIARAGLMGRPKAAAVRRQAQIQGWLDPAWPLPDDDVLAQTFDLSNPRSQSLSHVLPFEREVRQWHGQGIQGTTIHEALVRKHGFTGSYSSVRRFLQALQLAEPEVTTVLDFEPGGLCPGRLRSRPPGSSMSAPARSSTPGSSRWCWPGAAISTPNW